MNTTTAHKHDTTKLTIIHLAWCLALYVIYYNLTLKHYAINCNSKNFTLQQFSRILNHFFSINQHFSSSCSYLIGIVHIFSLYSLCFSFNQCRKNITKTLTDNKGEENTFQPVNLQIDVFTITTNTTQHTDSCFSISQSRKMQHFLFCSVLVMV